MKIEFYDWKCGHDGTCPESIEFPTSCTEVGERILKAIAAAISHGGHARAKFIHSDGFTERYFLMGDRVEEEY